MAGSCYQLRERGYSSLSEYNSNGDDDDRTADSLASLRTAFDGADENSDGVLSPLEFLALSRVVLPGTNDEDSGAMFEQLDSNGDGLLTFHELADHFLSSPSSAGSFSEEATSSPPIRADAGLAAQRMRSASRRASVALEVVSALEQALATAQATKAASEAKLRSTELQLERTEAARRSEEARLGRSLLEVEGQLRAREAEARLLREAVASRRHRERELEHQQVRHVIDDVTDASLRAGAGAAARPPALEIGEHTTTVASIWGGTVASRKANTAPKDSRCV